MKPAPFEYQAPASLRDDASGQLLTGTLADYLIPTATDFPRIRAITLENHPSPSNPLGVKGAGEGAIIPVGGLMANAVANALVAFGAMPNQLPLSPAQVWRMGPNAKLGEVA
jgi:carbon-monoxide dehydrogenase large subunit